MNIVVTDLPDVLLIEPNIFGDARGFFVETFHEAKLRAAGFDWRFVQDNHSRSRRGVLRGLHYQVRRPQGKLIRVARGEIFDVAVDIRRGSPTFGRWTCAVLNDENLRQIFVPPGFAHGFCVLSEVADVEYKCTEFYAPELERTILWNDPAIGIAWPLADPLLSDKDRRGVPLAEAELE